MKARTWHFLKLALAWLLIALGVMFLFSPIPIGIFFIAVGLSVLVTVSDEVSDKIRAFRGRHANVNRQLVLFEARLNGRISFIANALYTTRPSLDAPADLGQSSPQPSEDTAS